ncbi:MAG: hypothetical protein SOV23_05820 [Eubacteriales bacterium]|nr:hypothetical protein [Christensenellaceae bacterium]MDY2751750.1 hypothetical protein [Eubacteriales bacterium]
MKFKMKLYPAVYALTAFVLAITVASTVINVLILTDTGVFSGGKNVAVTVTSLVCGIILFVIAILFIANTYYQFCEKCFKISYGVVSIKIPYDSVLASAEEKLTKKLYLQTAGDKKKEFGIITVNVNPIYNNDIVKEFEKRCDNFRKLNLSDDNKD